MKGKFKATLTKLNANTKDKLDSIQFQLKEAEMSQYGDQILEMRRYDRVKLAIENPQGHMADGSVAFFKTEFQSCNTSISICVTEDGLICTITFSLDNRKVFNELVMHDLRNKFLSISFEEGKNPNK